MMMQLVQIWASTSGTLFELEIRQSGRYKMSKIHTVTCLHLVNIVDGLLF